MPFDQFVAWCASVRASLSAIHPALPWLVLSGVAWLTNLTLDRFGLTPRLEAVAPWGKLARRAIHDAPGVILAAAWPALTLGSTDVTDAVLGALSGLLVPVVRAVRETLPGGGSGGSGGGSGSAEDGSLGAGSDAGLHPGAPLSRLALVLLALLAATGCAVPLESARRDSQLLGAPQSTVDRCRSLDDARLAWGAVAKGAAVVSGSSGVAAIPFEDDPEARIALASVAAGAAVVGAVAVYVSEGKGEAWARECAGR